MRTDIFSKIKETVQTDSGIELKKEIIDQLAVFHDLVLAWNQKVNLVSRRDVGNLIGRHISDSLAPLKHWNGLGLPPVPEVMDLGSGGGFPGIPLKICRPEIRLTCLEATKKKARFIETAVKELGLSNVMVVDKHSEEIKKDPGYNQRYDLVVCRAVAELKELVELSFPFIKPGGLLMAYKGQRAEEEVKTAGKILHKLGGTMENFFTRSGHNGSSIAVIRKR
jgi:16S rRNA (guanine527-N7)-methyltransferase